MPSQTWPTASTTAAMRDGSLFNMGFISPYWLHSEGQLRSTDGTRARRVGLAVGDAVPVGVGGPGIGPEVPLLAGSQAVAVGIVAGGAAVTQHEPVPRPVLAPGDERRVPTQGRAETQAAAGAHEAIG